MSTEVRANLKLALPIVLTQFTFMGMGTVDTIMAGRMGGDALAAVAVGSNLWFLLFMVFTGLLMACSPIVAQKIGARRSPQVIGEFVSVAGVFAVGLGLLWTLLTWLLARPVIDLLQLNPLAASGALSYSTTVAWAGVPLCLCFVARNIAEGHGLTRVALMAGLVGFSVNAVLDYLLMFGHAGFPALGPVGCAWASLSASLAMCAVYLLLFRQLAPLRALQVFRWRALPFRDELREMLRLGVPIAMILAAEAWMFNIGALLLASFGSSVVAAHQIAINFAAVSFMVPLSVGFATTVRVGYAVGSGDEAAARLRGQAGILMGVVYAGMSALVMLLLPERIVALYTHAAGVAGIAVQFLYYAAVFQLFDCIQATASGALRGFKDTRVPMLITVSAYWLVGMPLALWLSFRTSQGPFGVWWGFVVALALAATGLAARFLRRSRITAAR